ncbi:hypothetical protein ES703_23151 [subsurface metagenome]
MVTTLRLEYAAFERVMLVIRIALPYRVILGIPECFIMKL